MREVLHAVRDERARAVDRELQHLSSGHSAVIGLRQDAAKGRLVMEFVDGTLLDLRIRDPSFDLDRLPRRFGEPLAWLEMAEPCFGHGWYCLRFVAVGHGPLDVLARVSWPELQVSPDARRDDLGSEWDR
jgi:hypothetical protein